MSERQARGVQKRTIEVGKPRERRGQLLPCAAVDGIADDGVSGLAQVHADCGSDGLTIVADMTSRSDVRRVVQTTIDRFGQIDAWVNNVGQGITRMPSELTDEDLDTIMSVNVKSALYGMQEVLPHFKARGRGQIVNVSSMLGRMPFATFRSAYCGAKHAIQGFMDALRCELLHDGSRVQVTMVQMPALNTPQFGWVKSRLPRKAQPVPPIYQPEVAAEAIVWAAHHPRRELSVGFSTVKAILENKIAPWLGDWYLARMGYAAQQTNEPADPNRRHNLWQPVPGDHGAHGSFDTRARDTSVQLWVDTHRSWFALAGLALAGLVYVAMAKHRR